MAVKTDLMPNHQKKLKKKRLQSLPHKVASNNSEKLSDNATISTKSNNNLKLVAQELKFAKLLAGNDPKISQKQLIKLQKWLKIRSQSSYPFDDQDFLRIWKGLFYGMWMCDKPLPQEKMADDLAALIHCFNDPALSIQFFGTFLQTINKEWFGIDQWRIDKFMMLVRRATRQLLVVLRGVGTRLEYYQQFGKCLESSIFGSDVSMGFFMHFTELFMEEVAKVFDGNIDNDIVTNLVQPFANYIAKPKNWKLSKHVVKNVFNFLLFQSDLGREYQEKFQAWKHMGFPGQSINELEMVNTSDQEENSGEDEDDDKDEEMTDDVNESAEEKALDPRAGRVNVVMPEITFNPMDIVNILEELLTKKYTNVKSRHILKRIINQYKIFANGEFPIGIRKMWTKNTDLKLPKIDDKVNELIQFENKLLSSTNQMKKLNKKKRRKHLQSGAKLPLDDLSSTNNLNRRRRHLRRIKTFTSEEKQIINSWQEEDINVDSKLEKISTLSPSSPPKIKITPATPTTPKTLSSPKRIKKSLASPQQQLIVNDNHDIMRIDNNVQSPVLRSLSTAIKSYDTAITEQQAALKDLSAAANLVINPAAIRGKKLKSNLCQPAETQSAPVTPISTQKKRVKIMLKLNSSQDTNEYIRQLRSSPNVPFDADKKPSKGLLKANLMPSPINPYYKKKIGLKF